MRWSPMTPNALPLWELLKRSQVLSQTQVGFNLFNSGIVRNSKHVPKSQHQKGQRGVLKLRDGTRKSNKLYLLEPTSNQPTSWLGHFLEHPWCQDKPRAILDSHDSPRLELGGSHHFPPYSILCASPRHPHPNGFLSWDSQGGVPKLSRFGLLGLCEVITLCSNL